jgi:hypothetical protein
VFRVSWIPVLAIHYRAPFALRFTGGPTTKCHYVRSEYEGVDRVHDPEDGSAGNEARLSTPKHTSKTENQAKAEYSYARFHIVL